MDDKNSTEEHSTYSVVTREKHPLTKFLIRILIFVVAILVFIAVGIAAVVYLVGLASVHWH